MAIDWTGYARIKLDNGVTISVNSETPGSASTHSKVVDAIIKAVGKIEALDQAEHDQVGQADKVDKVDQTGCNQADKTVMPSGYRLRPTGEVVLGEDLKDSTDEATSLPTPVVADAPAEENCSEGSPIPTVCAADGDSKPEEPAGNPPAPLGESAPAKPKLLIDIAKSTYSSGGEMEAISLTFHHLHEAMEGNKLWGKHAAAHFVECIGQFKFDNVLVFTMDNDQVIMTGAFAHRPIGHDKLVELAKQAIARTAMADEVADYAVSVR